MRTRSNNPPAASGLSPDVLLVMKAAAVAADEFEPSLVAAAAEVPHGVVLDVLVCRVT